MNLLYVDFINILNMRKILFALIIISALFSCKKVVSRTMDVPPDDSSSEYYANDITAIPIYSKCTNYNNNLSEIASDVTFILLEANPPINEFHICNIEFTDEFLFLSEMNRIMQFDKNGKYIKNIGRVGMGPEEFINIIAPLQIDRINNLIYVNDINRQRMMAYHFDGKLKKTFSFKGVAYKLLNPSKIAAFQSTFDREMADCPLISFLDSDGEVRKTYLSHNYPIAKEKKEHFGIEINPLWNNRKDFYYLEFGADTIFRISGDSLIPARVLTGDLKMGIEEHYRINTGSKLSVSAYIQRPNSGIFESDRYLIFRLSNDYERFFMIYDKNNKQLYRTFYKNAKEVGRGKEKAMTYFTDDIVSGLSFDPQYQSEGKAVAIIPAWEICEKKQEILDFINKNPNHNQSKHLKSVVQKMTDDDNPLLMIVSLK